MTTFTDLMAAFEEADWIANNEKIKQYIVDLGVAGYGVTSSSEGYRVLESISP